jgi:hypothetical protein
MISCRKQSALGIHNLSKYYKWIAFYTISIVQIVQLRMVRWEQSGKDGEGSDYDVILGTIPVFPLRD